jgi:hypothetical protein
MQLDWEGLSQADRDVQEHQSFSESQYWDSEDFNREAALISQELE